VVGIVIATAISAKIVLDIPNSCPTEYFAPVKHGDEPRGRWVDWHGGRGHMKHLQMFSTKTQKIKKDK